MLDLVGTLTYIFQRGVPFWAIVGTDHELQTIHGKQAQP